MTRAPATFAARVTLAALLALAMPARSRAQELPPTSAVGAARLGRAGGALPADHAIGVTYTGDLELEGHFERPHATRHWHSIRRILVTAPDRARQDWTTWQDGDSARTVETTLLAGDRVLRRDDAGAPWVELSGIDAGTAAWAVWSAAPALMTARGIALQGHGLRGGPLNDFRSHYVWPDPLGQASLEMDELDAPVHAQVVMDDPWRGSLVPDCQYFGSGQAAGATWPDSVVTIACPVGETWRLLEKRGAVEADVPLAALAMPDSVRPAPPASADTVPVVHALSPHVWSVELRDADTRSLALEFAGQAMVLDTGPDGPHGERLESAVRGTTGKPVRYVAFGHHHPDYIGGLRPFIADSATVVCAAANRAYVDEIAHWSFALHPDKLWLRRPGGMPATIDTLTAGRWRHADVLNDVEAIDIGAASHHTDHYLVFWLPRARILFEDDLGWFAGPSGVRASSRAAGLLQAIEAAKLAPATIVQGWTPGGTPASMSMRDFRALVAARAGR